jgi:hypothetical protein
LGRPPTNAETNRLLWNLRVGKEHREERIEKERMIRTLSRLIAASGIVGAIAATGGTAAVAQGVYLQGPGFGVDIGRPAYRERHYYRGYSDYDGPQFYSRRYRRGPYAYERR